MDIKIEPKDELDLSDVDENWNSQNENNQIENDIYTKSITTKREILINSSYDEFIIPDDGQLDNDLNESTIEKVVITTDNLPHRSVTECSSNKDGLVIKSETDSSEKYVSTNNDESYGKYLLNQTPPFKCNYCNYTADSPVIIEIHEKHHRDEKLNEDPCQLFVCKKCPFSTRFKPKYLYHNMIHYPYKCDVCPYASRKLDSLRHHRNIDPVKHYRYRKFALAMQNKLNNISSGSCNNEVLTEKSDSELAKTVFDEAIDQNSLDEFKERNRSSLAKKPIDSSSIQYRNELSYSKLKSNEIQKPKGYQFPSFESQTFVTDGINNISGGVVAVGGINGIPDSVQLFLLETEDENTTNSRIGNDKPEVPNKYHEFTDIESAGFRNIDNNDESITNGGTIFVITDAINQEDSSKSSKNDSNELISSSFGQTIALSACEKDTSSLVLLQVLEQPDTFDTNLQNRDFNLDRHDRRKSANVKKLCYDLNYDDDGLYEEKLFTKQVPLILKPKKPRTSKRSLIKEVSETVRSNEEAKIPEQELLVPQSGIVEVGKVSHEENVQKPCHKTISEDNLKSKDSQPSISSMMARKIFTERIEKVLASFTPSDEAKSELREAKSVTREAKSVPHEVKSVPHEAKSLKNIPKNRVRSKRKCTDVQKRCYDLHYDDDGLYDAEDLYAKKSRPLLEKEIILIDLADDSDTADSLKSNSNSDVGKPGEKPWYEIIHEDDTDDEV